MTRRKKSEILESNILRILENQEYRYSMDLDYFRFKRPKNGSDYFYFLEIISPNFEKKLYLRIFKIGWISIQIFDSHNKVIFERLLEIKNNAIDSQIILIEALIDSIKCF